MKTKSFLNLFFSLLFSSSLILVIPLKGSAQSNAIKILPEYSQGYLVLDEAAYPNVDMWEIAIYKNTYPGGVKQSTLEDSYRLGGINFINIPVEYYQRDTTDTIDYSYFVLAYDSLGDTLVYQGPERACQGCPPANFKELKIWKCNGRTYAWEVRLWRDDAFGSPTYGKYYLVFDQALDFTTPDDNGNGIPYYEWGPYGFFSTLCQNLPNPTALALWEWYGLAEGNCYMVNSNPKIISRPGVALQQGLRDYDCTVLSGDLWGVQKYLGSWKNALKGVPFYIGNDNLENYSSSSLITYINNNNIFDLETNLACSTCSGSPSFENSGWWGTGFEKPGWRIPNFPNTDPHRKHNPWSIISEMSDYLGGDELEIIGGNIWYGNMPAVQISRVDDIGMDVLIERDKIFDSKGDFVGPNLVFTPGLYRFEFIDNTSTGLPYYYEIETTEDYSIYAKDFLDVTIYPVPIVGNQVSIDFEAFANVEFTYTLYDPSLNIMNTQNFKFGKGYTGTEVITSGPSVPSWPSGNYVHYFLFTDGSYLSFITPKL